MATDTKQLQGEISETPNLQDVNVEKLLLGFLHELILEQETKKSGGSA